jgi:hypothetical protein
MWESHGRRQTRGGGRQAMRWKIIKIKLPIERVLIGVLVWIVHDDE